MRGLSTGVLCLALAGCSFEPAPTPTGSGSGAVDASSTSSGKADASTTQSTVDARIPSQGTPDASVMDEPKPDAGGGTTDNGAHHHFVTSSLRLGANGTEARSFAFDLDGNGTRDNVLGITLTALSAQLGDIDQALNDAIILGSQVLLHSVQAQNLESAGSAVWRTYRGEPQVSPDLSGTGSFTVAGDARRDSLVEGTLSGGHFSGGPGFLTVELTLNQGLPPLALELIGARAEIDVTQRSCSGRMGGAMTAAYLDSVVLPGVAALLDAQIAADGNCRQSLLSCSATSLTLLGLFDTNLDRIISADEVRSNNVVRAVLSPDVDLLDAEGRPGHDGVKESLSIAFAVSCVSAKFSAPWEE